MTSNLAVQSVHTNDRVEPVRTGIIEMPNRLMVGVVCAVPTGSSFTYGIELKKWKAVAEHCRYLENAEQCAMKHDFCDTSVEEYGPDIDLEVREKILDLLRAIRGKFVVKCRTLRASHVTLAVNEYLRLLGNMSAEDDQVFSREDSPDIFRYRSIVQEVFLRNFNATAGNKELYQEIERLVYRESALHNRPKALETSK